MTWVTRLRLALWRQGARWAGLILGAVAVLVVLGSLVLPGLSGSSASISATPVGPGALAYSAGTLYLVDPQLDEVLAYQRATGFTVVPGNGKRGDSGNGALAERARLQLGELSGAAVSPSGWLYFSDGDRVRYVDPSGRLGTAAGGGKEALGREAVPALRADLQGLAGLTFGPHGQLYIATRAGVYRLGADGKLHWVVGGPPPARFPPHYGGVYSNPAIENDFANAAHLAFDSQGDLFVAGGGGWGLYERTVAGRLRYVETLRGQGGTYGSVAEAPDGRVVAASGRGLQWVSADGRVTALRAAWPRFAGPGRVPFCACFGSGLTASSNGTIYVDTDYGDVVPGQGLFEVLPSNQVRWLWRAPG